MELHSGAAALGDHEPVHDGVGDHVEIGAVHRRHQIRVCGGLAPASVDGQIRRTETGFVAAADVFCCGIAAFDRCIERRGQQWVDRRGGTDAQRAVLASQCRVTATRGLTAHEVRQQVVEPPTLGPVVVALAVTPREHHRVDRGGPAEPAPPGDMYRAPQGVLDRGGATPVRRTPEQGLPLRRRRARRR